MTAVGNIEGLGFNVSISKNVLKRKGFTAGTDQERLDDLHAAFRDPQVKCVWAIRGGYGCTRLLPLIDYKLIKQNPKILMGFSDTTALSNAIFKHTGLIGFHGPIASWNFSLFNQINLWSVIQVQEERHTVTPLLGEAINTGLSAGRLVGGNLSVLAAMCGTGQLPDFKKSIVFLEDVGEDPYRIDRMITQLKQSTNLSEANGIILGEFHNCEMEEGDNSLTLKETLTNQFAGMNVPVLYNFPFGHKDNLITLPIGTYCEVDGFKTSISLLENSVV